MTGGWLTGQLPRAMLEDEVICALARVAEEIADSYRAQLDALEQHLDVAAASASMLRYVASWLGADLDPAISVERQREVLRAVGPLLGWRGTRRGVEGILEALTGGRVVVTDSGGVWSSDDARPPMSLDVRVELTDLGEMTSAQLLAYIGQEVPVGTQVQLRLGSGPLPGVDRDAG